MADNDKPLEAQVPNAMDPSVVQAKLREIEEKAREHEKALGDLRVEAALLGSDRQDITVTLVNGRVSVNGPLHDMITCFGMFEAGKVAILEIRRRQENAARAEALAAGGAKTPGGIVLPGSPAPPWVKQGRKG